MPLRIDTDRRAEDLLLELRFGYNRMSKFCSPKRAQSFRSLHLWRCPRPRHIDACYRLPRFPRSNPHMVVAARILSAAGDVFSSLAWW